MARRCHIKRRATRRQMPYKWRQIYRNTLLITWTLDKKGQCRRSHTVQCSATHLLQISHSSHSNSHSSHFNGRLLLWVSLWLSSYSKYSNTRTRQTCMGVRHCRKVSIRIFDLRKVGQSHEIQFYNNAIRCHMSIIYKRHFFTEHCTENWSCAPCCIGAASA